jgi:ABC-type glycerol-3-phosphate transport system substrate-binding protein
MMLSLPTVFAQEPIAVTWWTGGAAVDVEALNTLLVEPVDSAHPGIRLEVIPQAGLDDAVRVAFTAGSAPDILQTPGAYPL